MRRPCGTSATPRAAICFRRQARHRRRRTTATAPRRGGNRPTVTFMQVDLPAPLRPSRPSMPALRRARNDTVAAARGCRRRRRRSPLRAERVSGQDRPPCVRGSATTSARVALDDHFAEMQQRDALGEFQRHVHVVLDHHNGDVARDCQQQLLHVAALVDRQARRRARRAAALSGFARAPWRSRRGAARHTRSATAAVRRCGQGRRPFAALRARARQMWRLPPR